MARKPIAGKLGSTATGLRILGEITIDGVIKLPQDTASASDEAGLFRFNPTSGVPEVSNNTGGWAPIGGGGGSSTFSNTGFAI
jgi:hypothetical protein